ncbi:TPA: hypothetical protein ACHTSG_000033 [Legionella pneumophila]|nr:hypothetical protein [Legionella pneumophila]
MNNEISKNLIEQLAQGGGNHLEKIESFMYTYTSFIFFPGRHGRLSVKWPDKFQAGIRALCLTLR